MWTTVQAGMGTVSITAAGQTQTVKATRKSFDSSDTRQSFSYYQYQADLSGLSPDTPYTYSVAVGNQTLITDAFRTAGAGNQFSFLVFGDSGEATLEQNSLKNLMQAEQNIAMVVHTGDLAYPDGDYSQYETFYFNAYAAMMRRLAFFPVPGNHDNFRSMKPYLNVTATPNSAVPAGDEGRYYAFHWGNVHFAMLDTNLLGTDRAASMLAWLDQDLAKATKFWRVVVAHHPAYPTGEHIDDPLCLLSHQTLNAILEWHGVQMVLSGHEHGFERTFPLINDLQARVGEGTTYIISGGGGADLHTMSKLPKTAVAIPAFHYTRVDVDGGSLTLRAIGVMGQELDRVTLQPKPTVTSVSGTKGLSIGIASGGIISIFGFNLGLETVSHTELPLPKQAAGVSVRIGNETAPIVFASANQINCQVPFDLVGNETVSVTTANGTATAKVVVKNVAPSIVTLTYLDNVVSESNAAPTGSEVVAYMTGLGKVTGTAVAGEVPSGGNLVAAPVSVALGDVVIAPDYAGLSSTFAGLYQVNFRIPESTAPGSSSLVIGTAGTTSPPFSLFVAQPSAS